MRPTQYTKAAPRGSDAAFFCIEGWVGLVFDEVVAGHFGGLLDTHDVQNRGSDVGEYAVLNLGVLVLGHVHEGYGIERVCGVGGAVGIDCIVGIAVVGDDDNLVAVFLCGLNNNYIL